MDLRSPARNGPQFEEPGSEARVHRESNQSGVEAWQFEEVAATAKEVGSCTWFIPGLSSTLFVDVASRATRLAKLREAGKKLTAEDFESLAEPARTLLAKLDDFPKATPAHVPAAYALFRALANAYVIDDTDSAKPPILAKEGAISARHAKAQEQSSDSPAVYLARAELQNHNPEMVPLQSMNSDFRAVTETSDETLHAEFDQAASQGSFDDQEMGFLFTMLGLITQAITLVDLRAIFLNFVRHKEHDFHMLSWVMLGKEEGSKPGSGEVKKFFNATLNGYCGPTISRSHPKLPKTAAKVWEVVEEMARGTAHTPAAQHVAGGGPQRRFPPMVATAVTPFPSPHVEGAGKRKEMFDPESAEKKFQWIVESRVTDPNGNPYTVSGVPLMVYSDMTQLAQGILLLLKDTFAIRRAIERFRDHSQTAGVASRPRRRRVTGGELEGDAEPLVATDLISAFAQQAIPVHQAPALPGVPSSDPLLKKERDEKARQLGEARKAIGQLVAQVKGLGHQPAVSDAAFAGYKKPRTAYAPGATGLASSATTPAFQ